jgi:serine/threonine protein kinase
VIGNHVIDPLRPSDPPRLGSYRLVGRIGRGGMGTVYLAESAGGERAAVKVINPDLADDDMFRDRFRREVESARRVRRFCTAPVLDAQLDGEPLFIVTEFVDGPNLDQFVRDSGPMRGSNLEHLSVGVATALTAIHGAGVIHRDLKPANVLLSSMGPRVIDFGIARALDTVSGATRTGQFIGTPAFMAPELISGGKASPASDVFAWACVVAYAGTGRAPFGGDTVPAVLYQISHGEPSIDDLDEGLRHLVIRALAKDPRQRPSAQALLDMLTGRPHADSARAAESVGRTWPVQSGRATLADAPPSRALPAESPNSGGKSLARRPWALAAAGMAAVLVLGIGAFVLFGGPGGPPSNTTLAYSENFSNTSSGWDGATWFSDNGYYRGGYRIDAGGSIYPRRSQHAHYGGKVPERALIGADASVLGGPPYGMFGLYCRGSGDVENAAYYEFLVRADGQGVLIRKRAGKAVSKDLLRTSSAAGFRKGKKNRLEAACEQQGKMVRLRLWVNGTFAAETTDRDGPLPNGDGGFGLVAVLENGGSGGDIQALFDNFLLSEIH